MEPEEIARLYNEKKIILDSISEGIIAIDNENKILEINNNCLKMFENLNINELIGKLSSYIEKREKIKMKEVYLSGEKVFVNLEFIEEQKRKSIPLSYFQEHGYIIKQGFRPYLDYLKIIEGVIE